MSYAGKQCIVTGGGGSIGSNLVRRLLDEGASVEVLDDFSSGYQWLLPVHQNLKVRLFDVTKDKMRFPRGCVVMHLAGFFANARSTEFPERDLEVNGGGTLRVLRAAVQAKAEKVVYAGAGCAAGHEDSPYQISKALGEAYCRFYAKEVPVVMCRFHNSYGPGEVPGAWRNVVPVWIHKALRGDPLTIYGDGTDARDFVYVDDLVSAMLAAGPSPVPYALGTGTLTTTNDLAIAIRVLTGNKSEVVHRPRRRWDHPGTACATPVPSTVTLEQGLRRTVAWHRENAKRVEESASW